MRQMHQSSLTMTRFWIAVSMVFFLFGCPSKLDLQTDVASSSSPIKQSIYEITWEHDSRDVSARLILHRQADLASIAAMKAGRRFLTIWVRDGKVDVYFSREKANFRGQTDQPMDLMDGWPRLSAKSWISCLEGIGPGVEKVGVDHFQMLLPQGRRISWKLRKQTLLDEVADIVFNPHVHPNTEFYDLDQLKGSLEWKP